MFQQFTIYKRETAHKGKYTYYVQFRDSDGRRLPGRSSCQSTRGGAQTWAIEQIKQGIIPNRANITFGTYAENWFIWGKSNYIKRKQAHGNKISRGYAESRRIHLKNNITPYFKSRRLMSLKPHDIESWIERLRDKGLANGTINTCLSILKIMTAEAVRLRYLSVDPAQYISGLPTIRHNRLFPGPDKIKDLFNPLSIDRVWNGKLQHYTANLLAATTGMRMGEIQGLLVENFNGDVIYVKTVWEGQFGLKEGPKWGSYRYVSLPKITSYCIDTTINLFTNGEASSLVFQSNRPGVPICASALRESLYKALINIGIDPNERKVMNFTFHSWRHYFNSEGRKHLKDHRLQVVMGHKSMAMTDNYTHYPIEDFEDVRQFQEGLFDYQFEELRRVISMQTNSKEE